MQIDSALRRRRKPEQNKRPERKHGMKRSANVLSVKRVSWLPKPALKQQRVKQHCGRPKQSTRELRS